MSDDNETKMHEKDPRDLSVKTFITNDLSLAAYLVMHGIRLFNAERLGRSFKFEFEDDPRIRKLKMQFMGSESSRFDDAVRKLKKSLFSEG